MLLDKIGDAQLAKAEQNAGVRVNSKAELPKAPSSPNLPLNVIAGTGLGFLVSLFGAWLLAYFDNRRVEEAAPSSDHALPRS